MSSELELELLAYKRLLIGGAFGLTFVREGEAILLVRELGSELELASLGLRGVGFGFVLGFVLRINDGLLVVGANIGDLSEKEGLFTILNNPMSFSFSFSFSFSSRECLEWGRAFLEERGDSSRFVLAEGESSNVRSC